MRLTLAIAAALATSVQPASCGSPAVTDSRTIVAPWEAACQGLACGDPCGTCPAGVDPASCPIPTFAPTACSPRGQCLTVGSFICEGDGCLGRACGTSCDRACPFGAPCPAPVMCDGRGGCTGWRADLCYDPCAGLACGAACTACPPGARDCLETDVLKACGPDGACQPATPSMGCP
jgi:hypothetical protein